MIHLYNVLSAHPESADSAEKLKGFLSDLYPEIGDKKRINAIVMVYNARITDSIRREELNDAFLESQTRNVIGAFRLERKAAEWAIREWITAYGGKILGKKVNLAPGAVPDEQAISLTPSQQQAVYSKSDRIAVVAGPGSGKTRILTERIYSLVKNEGVDEKTILALTYSAKAAKEMRKRLRDRFGNDIYKLSVLTFHSFGLKIIRNNYDLLGYTEDFDILQSVSKNKVIRDILKDEDISEKEIPNYAQLISRAKSENNISDPGLQNIVKAYNARIKSMNAIDFDDMIALPNKLFSEHPEILKQVWKTYRYVLVDEVQDLDLKQVEMLNHITAGGASIFVVGDDDQCIYEWRGAMPDFLKKLVSNSEYEVIRLQENFRSNSAIVKISDSLIVHNIKRIAKKLLPKKQEKHILPDNTVAKRCMSQQDEALFITQTIEKYVDEGKYNYSDFAVLVRRAQQAEAVKSSLEAASVPYFEQTSDNGEYNDFLPVLQTVANFQTRNGINRAINFPSMIMDNFLFEDIIEKYNFDRKLPIAEIFHLLYNHYDDFEDAQVFKERFSLIKRLSKEAGRKTVYEIISELRNQYLSEPFASRKKVAEKIGKLETLLDMARDFDSAYSAGTSSKSAIREFVDYLYLAAEDQSSEECSQSAVNIMTCHKSKGLEFPVVFIPGVQVGVFPNDYFIKSEEDVEAERRLFYVSMTRAIDHLYITCYEDPMSGKGLVKNGFLAEIPGIRFH